MASTHSDFNGHFGIDTMLVVKIDAIHVQPLQTPLTSRMHVGRISLDYPFAVLENIPELGGELNFVSVAFNCL